MFNEINVQCLMKSMFNEINAQIINVEFSIFNVECKAFAIDVL
jgi:hypothetical protein